MKSKSVMWASSPYVFQEYPHKIPRSVSVEIPAAYVNGIMIFCLLHVGINFCLYMLYQLKQKLTRIIGMDKKLYGDRRKVCVNDQKGQYEKQRLSQEWK